MSDSMYSSIDENVKWRSFLFKGPSGGGKTTKAAEFPSPVIFNFDNNLSGLSKLSSEARAKVRIINPQMKFDKKAKKFTGELLRGEGKELLVWNNFVEILEVVADDDTVHTIVIDSITTLVEYLFDLILKTSNPATRPEIQHWGDMSRYLKWLGEELLTVPGRDKHIIVTAHEDYHTDNKTKNSEQVLSIGGKMKKSFDLYFTDVWRVYLEPFKSPPVYKVRTLGGVDVAPFSGKCSIKDLPIEFEWDKEKQKVLSIL